MSWPKMVVQQTGDNRFSKRSKLLSKEGLIIAIQCHQQSAHKGKFEDSCMACQELKQRKNGRVA